MARVSAACALIVVYAIVLATACGGGGNPEPAALVAPGNVQATPGDGAITVSWDAVTGADGYVVYLARQPGLTKSSYAALLGSARITGRTSPARIDSLVNGATYWLLVTAVRTSPAAESAESAIIAATPTATPRIGDTMPATGVTTDVTATSATLHGSFTGPAGYQTSVWFEYGPTTAYGSSTPAELYLTSGPVDYGRAIFGLPPLSTIHYRLVTRNAGGTFTGGDATLTTVGQPAVLLSDLDAPTDLVSDGAALYWLEVYSARVRRYDLSTGTTSTIVTPTLGGNSASLALDPSWLYFASQDGGLQRAAHDGSSFAPSFSTVVSNVSDLVAHSTGLYLREEWLEQVQPNLWVAHQYVTCVSLDGGTRTRLYERTGGGSTGFGGGLALDTTSVYFSDYFLGTVQRVPLAGGTPVTLATSLAHPGQLLLDGHDLYVAVDDGIRRIDVTTGQIGTVHVATGGVDLRFAKEGGFLYVSGLAGGLSRIDLSTGSATLLALQPEGGGAPIITPSAIYWVVPGNHYGPPMGRLERLTKP